jgi:hypothetical protein
VLIFVDPAVGDLLKRDRVEVMQFLAAPPNGHNKVRFPQKGEMFRSGLPCHLEMLAEFTQSLAIFIMQLVEQLSSAWIGEGLKDFIHSTLVMQPNSCMSSNRLLIRVCAVAFRGYIFFRNAENTPDLPPCHSEWSEA